jgi:hypothetical protein
MTHAVIRNGTTEIVRTVYRTKRRFVEVGLESARKSTRSVG